MKVEIRAAGPDDVETLRDLIGAMGYQVGADEVRARLEALPADGHAVFVAEGVGWVHVAIGHSLIVGARAEIAGLAVAPQAQGRGVGTALLAAAEGWAAERGVRTVYLRSGAERTEAHGFYRSRGYEAVKTQVALSKKVG